MFGGVDGLVSRCFFGGVSLYICVILLLFGCVCVFGRVCLLVYICVDFVSLVFDFVFFIFVCW